MINIDLDDFEYLANKYRKIAFENEINQSNYKHALEDINKFALDGALNCWLHIDNTVKEMLKLDGFQVECNDVSKNVIKQTKISW